MVRSFVDGSVLVVDLVANCQDDLLSNEKRHAGEMTVGRLREYRAGRSVARRAIEHVTGNSCGIPMGVEGEPLWPDGVSGSISHAGGYAAALAASHTRYTSVGLDVNDGRALGQAAAVDLMTDSEIAIVLRGGWAGEVEAARNVVFSAKEALFKCQYPLIQLSDLEFNEVALVEGADRSVLRFQGINLPSGVAKVIHRVIVIPYHIQGLMIVVALYPATTDGYV